MKRSEELKLQIEQLEKEEYEKTKKRKAELEVLVQAGDIDDSEMWNIILKERDKSFDEKINKLKHEMRRERLLNEVQVGDGVTICLYSDKYACTVIRRTAKMLVVQRDKATLSKDFKPEFIPGGFSAHCINQEEQEWTYERNEKGQIYNCYWSESKNCWQAKESSCSLRVILGRHEYYDYNF